MTRRIGERYELTERLGRGGMGEVWAARDTRLDRPVAVKFLTAASRGGDPDRLRQRFLREARLTARITHPSVPVVHEFGQLAGEDEAGPDEPGGTLYLVMEHVEGATLSRLLRSSGTFPVHLAATVAAQTADALAHAHRIGVVHRDLKPSNLMLTPGGTVKVLDFGIAAALEPDPDEPRLTQTQELLGTAGFIAPEQTNGERATPHSDLYALGCVVYELLAGAPPFEAATPMALLYQHVYEEPPALRPARRAPRGRSSMTPLRPIPEGRPAWICVTMAPMKRVVILGRGGAGKSTLAARLGEITGLPVIELDKHFWRPGLEATPRDEWAAIQRELVRQQAWIMDGDLGPYDVLDIRLQAADTIILLDFSFCRCAWRAIRRSRERIDFWLWLWTYRRRSRPLLLTAIATHADQANLHLLRTPRALRRFVAQAAADKASGQP